MRLVSAAMLLALAARPAAAGVIDTVAGTGAKGYSGDGARSVRATLNQPFHCDICSNGRLYIAEDQNNCVRVVTKIGTILTVAGTGKKGYSGDGGKATKATFNQVYAVVASDEDDLYIVDRLNAVIRKVDGKTQIVTTLAGTGKSGYSGDGGPATKAMLSEPNDCYLDGKGGLLIADVADWRVRRVDLKTGVITTFAGTGRRKPPPRPGEKGDGGPATKAVLHGPRAVCVDGEGNTYICEREGNCIRKVDAKGVITTVAGTGEKGSRDGPALKATFNGPKAVRCDVSGNVYIADTENHSVRKLNARAGTVTTVAGGRKGGHGDGKDGRKAGLARPHGVAIDEDGVLYIADSENYRVRRVRP
jgi:NHL repeat